MVSATGVLRTEGFAYALDNGAWTAYQKKQPFNAKLFMDAVKKLGANADFIVVPDVVAGGLGSLRFSQSWIERLVPLKRPLLLPVQDGMEVKDVRPYCQAGHGIFVGGTTKWKEATMYAWGCLARECGVYIHAGRINSQRKLKLCQMCLMDSFDGSGASKWLLHAKVMNAAHRQNCLAYEGGSPR
jgi:hypothetical protein